MIQDEKKYKKIKKLKSSYFIFFLHDYNDNRFMIWLYKHSRYINSTPRVCVNNGGSKGLKECNICGSKQHFNFRWNYQAMQEHENLNFQSIYFTRCM
jgi:hypothetical protein